MVDFMKLYWVTQDRYQTRIYKIWRWIKTWVTNWMPGMMCFSKFP